MNIGMNVHHHHHHRHPMNLDSLDSLQQQHPHPSQLHCTRPTHVPHASAAMHMTTTTTAATTLPSSLDKFHVDHHPLPLKQ